VHPSAASRPSAPSSLLSNLRRQLRLQRCCLKRRKPCVDRAARRRRPCSLYHTILEILLLNGPLKSSTRHPRNHFLASHPESSLTVRVPPQMSSTRDTASRALRVPGPTRMVSSQLHSHLVANNAVMFVGLRRVYRVREEVGEVLLQPLPAVVRKYVRYCVDVSAMAAEPWAECQPLRPLR